MISHVLHFFRRAFLSFEIIIRQKGSYSEINYIFGPNSFFLVLFVLYTHTHTHTHTHSVHALSHHMQRKRKID
jgi:hypothetical protein